MSTAFSFFWIVFGLYAQALPVLESCSLSAGQKVVCKKMSPTEADPIRETLNNLGEHFGVLLKKVTHVQVAPLRGTAATRAAETVADIDLTTGEVRGYIIRISKSALDSKTDLSLFVTLKESLLLSSAAEPLRPRFKVLIPSRSYPTLYYILLHELAHVVWHEYEVDQVQCTKPLMSARGSLRAAVALELHLAKNPHLKLSDLECEYAQNSFMNFSWLNRWILDERESISYRRLPQYEVAELSKICFSGCGEVAAWTAQEIQNLYLGIYRDTPFTSLYSAYFSPQEDFAESFALRALAYKRGNVYEVTLPSGESFDLLQKTKDIRFKAKYFFIDDLLKRIVDANKLN